MEHNNPNNNPKQHMPISPKNTIPEKYLKEIEKKKIEIREKEEALLKSCNKFGCAKLTDFNEQEIKTESDDCEERIALKNEIFDFLKQKKLVEDISSAIFIEPSSIHESVDAAEQILINKKCDIFQRAGKLVRLVKVASLPKQKKESIKRHAESIVIKEIDHMYLNEQLTRLGIWARFAAREKEFQKIACPEKISRYLLARQEWSIPVLSGVVNAPTLRCDGTILDTTGYDYQSGIFFIDDGTKFENIPENPSKDEAKKALNIILDLIKDFPFDNDVSKSVAISAILTGLIRKSISTAPLHCFTAPQMASGKSLLADIVSLIALGKPNSVISHADNETEEKKRLLAVLIEGDPIVCYDNIEEPFGSEALCSILTQESFKGRLLGKNENATAPTSVFFLATGNNLVLAGDLTTRALICKIDPAVERPEERSFDRDLRKYIPENRSIIVPAALTILRAYIAAGKPKQTINPYGRFEEYSDLVRSAIVWMGLADPNDSRKEIEDSDPVRIVLGNLLFALHDNFGDQPKRVKDIIRGIQHLTDDQKRERLKEALFGCAGDLRGEINERRLGNQLSKFNGRIENGYRLEKAGMVQNAVTWRVIKVADLK